MYFLSIRSKFELAITLQYLLRKLYSPLAHPHTGLIGGPATQLTSFVRRTQQDSIAFRKCTQECVSKNLRTSRCILQ